MEFTKMQGAGNDFIIINNIIERISKEKFPYIAKSLCSRRLSIGADGIMFIDEPDHTGNFKMHFFNSDGTEGEMCGNGARCICRYGFEIKLAGESQKVETKSGLVEGFKIDNRHYRIKLNNPTTFNSRKILKVGDRDYECSYVELGSPGLPHLVVELPMFDLMGENELQSLGKALRSHDSLEKGANVNFFYKDDNTKIKARTFERGVEDFTLACGTGAGSIGLTLARKGVVDGRNIEIEMPGGVLKVEILGGEDPGEGLGEIYLTGPTNLVCRGEVTDEDFIL